MSDLISKQCLQQKLLVAGSGLAHSLKAIAGFGSVAAPCRVSVLAVGSVLLMCLRAKSEVLQRSTVQGVDVYESLSGMEITQQPSVADFSDVKPTDWAYQALRSLMERYSITFGYSDRTFDGKKPISRYEFAVALTAMLEKFDSLVVNPADNQYLEEDIITIRRLKTEYRSALNDLQRSVSRIEARATQLSAHPFSTTTKFTGEAIIAFTDSSDANSTVVSRTRLTLSTSFNQKDQLVTQLEAGNNGGDAIGLAQNKNLNLVNSGGLDYGNVETNLKLRRLYYSFRPASDVAVTVGAKMLPRDFIDRNSYANNEAMDFSSSFLIHNPLIVQNQIDLDGGAGGAIAWNPGGGKFTLRSLYIAANSGSTNAGLFGDRHQASVEFEYLPSKKIGLRLQYTNALINNTDINAFGVNAEYRLNRTVGVFSRLGFGDYQGFNTTLNQNLGLHPFSWTVGLGVRDLLFPGTVAGIAIGQPLVSNSLGNVTQTNFETFYNLNIRDNLSITPTLSVVINANNDSSNGTIWQSTFRTVISF